MKILIEVVGDKVVSAQVISAKPKKAGRAVERAVKWLTDNLAAGVPVPSTEIFMEAERAGVNRTALYRAKKILGIDHYPVGYRACDGWTWELRKDEQTNMAHDAIGDAGYMG